MILVADSGSTKTDWVLLGQRSKKEYRTSGINPYFMSKSEISIIISKTFDVKQRKQVDKVYFYGAGCAADIRKDVVIVSIRECFPEAVIYVDTDLAAAARALFGNNPGIACILGTGSNCGFYDGKSITFKYPSLGYILGDEGSGSAMGKHLLREYLYDRIPVDLKNQFSSFIDNVNRDKVMEQVYNSPFPNRYLASFIPFIKKHDTDNWMEELIYSNLDNFFQTHILNYPDVKMKPIGFCGTISVLFSGFLFRLAMKYGLTIANTMDSPIQALADFHKKELM